MKALNNNNYSSYEISTAFNNIILSKMEGHNGTKKERLQSFLKDIQQGKLYHFCIYLNFP